MNSPQIRRRFLDFFAERGHTVVPSSSLVPAGDPTLLFTNAGMVQFKDVFLGRETRPYRRAVTVQKVVRAGGKHNDLEEVGRTARHQTFFEMLGNFSFGDYFKREAIDYAWTFLTQELGLRPADLWVSVYEEDDEARRLWREVAHLPDERIVGLGMKDNFWQMGDTGPCGPCSEIYIDRGEAYRCGAPVCAVGVCGCDRWLELWNLVFMQYDRDSSGTLHPLPRPSIDTGMGLERIASVLQGVDSNFETDLFLPLMRRLEALTGRPYDRGPGGFAFRVLADHARSATFLLADGVVPANEGRGYVLRRILRRAVRVGREVGDGHQLSQLVPVVAEVMGDAYPEVRAQVEVLQAQVRAEEDRFLDTLDAGNARLQEALARATGGVLDGREAFTLYDTYGFPLDLTEEIARQHGVRVDRQGFEAAMAEQRRRARQARAQAGRTVWSDDVGDLPPSQFVGYETLEAKVRVGRVWDEAGRADRLHAGEEGYLYVDPTPFYAEGGGQVGDQGRLVGVDTLVEVLDTQKVAGRYVSRVRVVTGSVGVGEELAAEVDRERREGAMRNHTGTHILHQALREVLGSHVRQTGSLVAPDRLRFDFSHPRPLTLAEIRAVEDLCNATILADLPVDVRVTSLADARSSGALMFFDEKYGDEVRVVSVGAFSRELCGGTHCQRSGQVGLLKIVSETGIGSGMRRVEAVTGKGALAYVRQLEDEERETAQHLGARPGELARRAQEWAQEVEELRREVERWRDRERSRRAKELLAASPQVEGLTLTVAELSPEEAGSDLRPWADAWRAQHPDGVAFFLARQGDRLAVLVAVHGPHGSALHAAHLMRSVVEPLGGRGGGRRDLAQGGLAGVERLGEVLSRAALVGRQALEGLGAAAREGTGTEGKSGQGAE